MQTAATAAAIDEPRLAGTEDAETEMEQKPQSAFSVTQLVVSILALLLGIIGGLLASVASNAEWKGKMEQRMETLEKQRLEDKQTWEYIRTQNEVNGRVLTQIQADINAQRGRR